MSRVNVAVLRGGDSPLYEESLQTGATVLSQLPEERYNTKDVLIDREGTWHVRGLPVSPHKALQDADVAFVALHGNAAEDGSIQKVLNAYNVPYTGSNVFGSVMAVDKSQARARLKDIPGIKVPQHIVLNANHGYESPQAAALAVFGKFGPRYIVKPLRGGGSLGVLVADSLHELTNILELVFDYVDSIIIEQFVQGQEATCGVVENFREQSRYTLPPVQIQLPAGSKFFDYDAKCDPTLDHMCPANLSSDEKERLQDAARAVHDALGLRHYSRSDFIVTPKGLYFLEANTLPELSPHSLLPRSLDAVGVQLPEFLQHVVTLAHERR